jgi:hypothetical protein
MTSSRTPGSRDQMSARTEHCRPRAKSPSTPASKFCCSLTGLPIDERFGLRSSGPISLGVQRTTGAAGSARSATSWRSTATSLDKRSRRRPDHVAPKPYELGPNPAPHNDRHQSVASRPEPASWREGRAARSRGASRASWHQPGRSARSRARDPPVGMDSSYSRCPSNGGIPSPTSVLPVAGAQRIPPGRQKVLGGAVMAHRQRVCQPVAQRTAGAVEGAVLPCTPRAPTRWAASAPVQPVTTTTLSCKIWPSC